MEMDTPSFKAEEIPYGRSGSTIKGAGIWQVLINDFLDSGLTSAKVSIGDRDYKQAYASLAHAIKMQDLRGKLRAVRRNSVQSVYLQRISVEAKAPKSGNGNGQRSAEVQQAPVTSADIPTFTEDDFQQESTEDATQSYVA